EGVQVLLFLVGPPLTAEPYNLAWEARGGLSLLWLIVAVWAPVLRRDWRTQYEAWVCLGLFLFAMGGAILFQSLPGFNLFRQPARMVVVATLPMAWLAAVAIQVLLAPGGIRAEQKEVCQRWLIRILVGVAILLGGFVFRQRLFEGKSVVWQWYFLLG